jgi:aspartate carbamoyltransferase catalytic subunit
VITQQVTNGIAVRMAVLFDALGSGIDGLDTSRRAG